MRSPTTSAPTQPAAHLLRHTPAQARVLGLLGRHASGVGPEVDVAAVRAHLDDALAPLVATMPDGATVTIHKSALHQLARCEASWVADQTRPFRWSLATARGTVAHKAIELGCNWRGPAEPGRLVDEAIDRLLEAETGLGTHLRTLTTVDLAELRRDAVRFVTAFEEVFPPLRSRWRPVIDGPVRVTLAGARVVLVGRPDLTLGRAGDGGKVIIDVKTGAPSPHHSADLSFYALLDALRLGIAPRRVATLYLESGVPEVDDVTERTLENAAGRVVEAVRRMIDVRTGSRSAQVRPGALCARCPALADCPKGAAHLIAAPERRSAFWWTADGRDPATHALAETAAA